MKQKDPPFNRLELLLVGSLFLFATYLYFFGLNNPLILDSDETKAYLGFFPPTPGLYMFSQALVLYFKSFNVPYYVNAFFGLASSMVLFGIVRILFDKRLALLTTLVFVVMDLPLAYSKLLFYSTLVTFFALFAIWTFLIAETKNKPYLHLLSGLSQGVMFMMHPSAYAAVIGVGACALFMKITSVTKSSKISWWVYLILSGLGFVFCVLLIDHLFNIRVDEHNRSYFTHMLYHQKNSSTDLYKNVMGVRAFLTQIEHLWSADKRSLGTMFRHGIVYISLVVTLFCSIRYRDKRVVALLILPFVGMGVLFVAGYFNMHTVFLRHYIYMAGTLSFVVAYTMRHAWLNLAHKKKLLATALFLIYISMSAVHAISITNSLVSLDDIDKVLKDNKINKWDVVTGLYIINRIENYMTRKIAPMVPTIYQEKGNMEVVNWPQVFANYKAGRYHYFLSSGLGRDYYDGQLNDVILKNTKPMATWPHPRANKYLMMNPQSHLSVSLYSIEDLYLTVQKIIAYNKQAKAKVNPNSIHK